MQDVLCLVQGGWGLGAKENVSVAVAAVTAHIFSTIFHTHKSSRVVINMKHTSGNTYS